MTVEDALRILGAGRGASRGAGSVTGAVARDASGTQRAPQPTAEPRVIEVPTTSDWRQALREAGAAPGEMAKKSSSESDARPTPGSPAPPAPSAPPAAASRTTASPGSAPVQAPSAELPDIPAGLSVGTAA